MKGCKNSVRVFTVLPFFVQNKKEHTRCSQTVEKHYIAKKMHKKPSPVGEGGPRSGG